MEWITYGLNVRIGYMKINRWGWREAGTGVWTRAPISADNQSRAPQAAGQFCQQGSSEKSQGRQLEFEYIESGRCVGPNYFPGKCLGNAHWLGTWPWASNAQLLLVVQSVQTVASGATMTLFHILVMPAELAHMPWTLVSLPVKWGYKQILTGFLWNMSLPNTQYTFFPFRAHRWSERPHPVISPVKCVGKHLSLLLVSETILTSLTAAGGYFS